MVIFVVNPMHDPWMLQVFPDFYGGLYSENLSSFFRKKIIDF